MKRTNLFRLSEFLFTVLCVFVFLFNSCKKDDDKPKGDQYEPNNSIAETSSVTFGTEINVSLTDKDDIDFYKFSGATSGKLDLLKFTLTNNSPDANFTITIYDKDKKEITQVPYAGSGVNLNYEMATTEDEFYVKVSGKDASSYPANYALTVGFTNAADTFENNDEITTASLFPLNKIEECNLLPNDSDFYKIQNLDNENVWDVYEVKLVNKSTDMSPAIDFFDASKTEIEELATTAKPGKDITKQIFMKSGADNAQYLKISSLSPLAELAGYTLEVTKKNANEASEPNDTYSIAQEVTSSGTYQGTIIKKKSSNLADCDIDFIKITVPANKKFSYSITGSNIQYDEYYSYSSTGEPNIYGSNEDARGVTTSWGTSPRIVYYYIAFKATADLSTWNIDINITD